MDNKPRWSEESGVTASIPAPGDVVLAARQLLVEVRNAGTPSDTCLLAALDKLANLMPPGSFLILDGAIFHRDHEHPFVCVQRAGSTELRA